ncbi:hypothetical protein J3R82DRAFT_7567 [Butyriboletus roseoflavus]|nr:hypothetical protein J3R82DRAFT_7567 [Butyriboletus roseoflavus]
MANHKRIAVVSMLRTNDVSPPRLRRPIFNLSSTVVPLWYALAFSATCCAWPLLVLGQLQLLLTCPFTVRRSSGRMPAPSEHPSGPSPENARQHYIAKMEDGTLDHYTARRAYAKRRDDNCCMLTGERDYSDGGFLFVEAAHHSSQRQISGKRARRWQFQAGGVWTILSMFTDVNIVEGLAGKRIHRLENIMLMELNCHAAFDELFLWLKTVEGSPHTYHVCEARRGHKIRLGIPDIVTFCTATEYPLPNTAYLALHALCCEVDWKSGASEYLMDIDG